MWHKWHWCAYVCPAIKHLDTIIGDDMWRCIVLDAWHWCRGWGWAYGAGGIGTMHGWPIIDVDLGNVHNNIGTVIPELSHHEFVEVLFVFSGEVLAKFNQGLVSCWLDAPGVTCGGEDAGCFKHDEHQIADGTISQQITSHNGDVLGFTEAFPKCLDRIIWSPHAGNAGAIGFQVAPGDGSIGGTQMGNHVHNGNFGKSKSVIIKCF